jgi:hypothetical protein
METSIIAPESSGLKDEGVPHLRKRPGRHKWWERRLVAHKQNQLRTFCVINCGLLEPVPVPLLVVVACLLGSSR